ncbi:DinB superfamily protein [Sinomicrobium oceani]|uniref:DinB superfamily protein n=1 Tax=Sinomicrobium oceani TaxID=1150368 RepID=A0A1K1NLF7_9FLAO|nr:DinB family protein [Sinomicrobium oceani]SFW36280.1 DinB superfamily protein [Sinomicrobium oceani]
MKKTAILIVSFLTLTAFAPGYMLSTSVKSGTEAGDKQFLLDYYKETAKKLTGSIKGLSKDQLGYQPKPESWSINQCLEHIILTEAFLFENIKKLMEAPANPERREEIKITDEDLIKTMTDRSYKAKAPEPIQPASTYTDTKTALKDFEKQRKEILKFIKDTPIEELRNHVADSPMGPIDAYQYTLLIAAHGARHTLQIEEVKESPGFPAK